MPESSKDMRQRESDALEEQEWLESLDDVIKRGGEERVHELLRALQRRAAEFGISLPYSANTPYLNTIGRADQPRFPGQREIERRIKSIIRWNAMAMVVRANRDESGIGGHISTYASAATLYEVGFNHFFKGKDHPDGGDQIYFQGHASPGIYARAFMEGRLGQDKLENFRRELKPGGGLPSYPHPRAMPDFWEFPTVSMGLGPIMAIYQARFNRYLEDRGLVEKTGSVWAFLGDGETDEPESLGAISLAAREKLDNLTFVINCNLQRLDGPVRGNGKIIQELEASFRGAGWNVIKVVWGDAWDPLLARDEDGLLAKRMEEAVDGDYQNFSVKPGSYIREHFFGTHPKLRALVEHLTDEELSKLRRGGHDPEKVYAAYKAAVDHRGAPTVILAKTVKGYGLGEAGEGKNITHQQKKLNLEELREFRSRFGIPISDEDVGEAPFYRPDDDSPEMRYLRERREQLGGFVPTRKQEAEAITPPPESLFEEFYAGTDGREASTTMVIVRMLAQLLKDKNVGDRIVPIVPDEARTFGMEALFRQVGIYSHVGQCYEPVDRETLLYYKEATDGQILEEGITEAGSISSFIASGTSYASHGVTTIPVFIYYSMFGFQRIGDLIWAAGDMRCRGFLIGGTAGRTTLAGEGLQHQDGSSHVLASTHPHVVAYDPAFAYEVAVLMQDGIRRMYVEQENICFYLTVENEPYAMPAMPEGVREGIVKGAYMFRREGKKAQAGKVKLLGSGAILNEVLKAQQMLKKDYGIDSEVWSVTSYQQLLREALEVARWNRLHPNEKPRTPYVGKCFAGSDDGLVVAASDYMKSLSYSLRDWIGGEFVGLGTDGFGRSERRSSLRDYFEVDARHVTWAVLESRARNGAVGRDVLEKAAADLGIDPSKPNSVDFLGGAMEVKLPELGENIETVEVSAVLVEAGTRVAKDQPLIEVETEKANLEVPAPVEGTVTEVLVKVGDKLEVGQTIVRLDADDAPVAASTDEAASGPAGEEQVVVAAVAIPQSAEVPPPQSVVDVHKSVIEVPAARSKPEIGPSVPASPSVRRLARELGVDILDVAGSGPGGRISPDDVKAHAKRIVTDVAASGAAVPAASAVELPDFSQWGEIAAEPLSNIRRATAKNMAMAWATVPHVTQFDRADITQLESMRKRFNKRDEAEGRKLSMTAIVLKMVSAALRQFPKFNASLDLANDVVIFKKYIHLGVAVDTERGLLVPVIRDADRKGLVEVAGELNDLAKRARDKKLGLDEMSGASFTVSNLGGLGTTYFSPIVNWPQVAILGVGRAEHQAVFDEGQFQPRLMMPLSISYDHRIIDGADAARFLRWLAEALEQPLLLLLDE